MRELDLNCDMGEGFGAYRCGDDLALLDHVSSANIACGFHAGDHRTMAATVKAAAARGVAIGAHPGLPDLQGFGRREMQISPAEVYELTVYQIGALKGFTAAAGVALCHVKAHGALYNMAARDAALADAICRAVRDVDASMVVFALAGSKMVEVARGLGLQVACEVFADRSYQDDGSLTPRSQPGAMLTDAQQAMDQVLGMALQGEVRALSGRSVRVQADTLCIHGDQPDAVVFAQRLAAGLREAGVLVRAVARADRPG
jgi:UPF0271 protein